MGAGRRKSGIWLGEIPHDRIAAAGEFRPVPLCLAHTDPTDCDRAAAVRRFSPEPALVAAHRWQSWTRLARNLNGKQGPPPFRVMENWAAHLARPAATAAVHRTRGALRKARVPGIASVRSRQVTFKREALDARGLAPVPLGHHQRLKAAHDLRYGDANPRAGGGGRPPTGRTRPILVDRPAGRPGARRPRECAPTGAGAPAEEAAARPAGGFGLLGRSGW